MALVDLFDETSMSAALITETWLTKNVISNARSEDLEYGENISLIRKDRGGRKGGGVAIAYNNTNLSLSEVELVGAKRSHEIVAAKGRDIASGKELLLISVYLPPSTGKSEVKSIAKVVSENISRFKMASTDIKTIVAGDLNKKNFSSAINDFPLIKKKKTGPTRKNKVLDVVFTDLDPCDVTLLSPIETENGVPSDHKTILCSADLLDAPAPQQEFFFTRPLSEKGKEKFSKLLIATDWSVIFGDTCSSSAAKLADLLASYVDDCFPLKRHKANNKFPVWITPEVRRKRRQKNRTYKREGRSALFYRQRAELNDLITENKVRFVEKVKEKVRTSGNTSGFYKAAKSLQSKEMSADWNIKVMYPSLSELEIAELVAEFFIRISNEYLPIDEPSNAGSLERIEEYEIAARLRHCKKPKSQLYGDIPPNLVSPNADILAIPLAHIFNQSINERAWPRLWKKEIVNVIPKTAAPADLGELRNISCTPLFSKVFEFFVLEDLKKSVSLSKSQFGGIKGISTDHFLIESWQHILRYLEDPNAAASITCLLYTSPSPRDGLLSRMPSSA